MPLNRLSSLWVGIAMLWTGTALANILVVPAEFPTIQAALDTMQSGDTVFVAAGTYVESLVAPTSVSFLLAGARWLDSTVVDCTLIDPSDLPGSQSLSALTLSPQTDVRVAGMNFRNRAPMYSPPRFRSGGIHNESRSLELTNCRFDSVFFAVSGDADVVLSDCKFILGVGQCVRTITSSLIASRCLFSGQGFWLVSCGNNSHFDRCRFRDNRIGHLLTTGGRNVVIENCIFGPYGPYPFSVVSIPAESGCMVSSCVFDSCLEMQSALEIAGECPNSDEMPIEISDVTISNFTRGSAIAFVCQGQHAGFLGKVTNVTIVNGTSRTDLANGILIVASADVEHTTFTNLRPFSTPDIFAARSFPNLGDSIKVRFSEFEAIGEAVFTDDPDIDARECWWGDSTGPFHAELNPNGRGGMISGNVQFFPWLGDSIMTSSEHSRRVPVSTFELDVFPNPFNNEIRIIIAGFTRDDFVLRLFNLQGREISVLHRGPLTGGQLSFTAPPELASGVYFVVASDQSFTDTRKAILLK